VYRPVWPTLTRISEANTWHGLRFSRECSSAVRLRTRALWSRLAPAIWCTVNLRGIGTADTGHPRR
jgi:hypothetical protein